MSEWVERWAERAATAPALVTRGQSITYGELERAVSARARAFRRAGVRKGDRVPLVAHLTLDGVVRIHALYRLGAEIVALHPDLTQRELADALALASPTHPLQAVDPDLGPTDPPDPTPRPLTLSPDRVAAVLMTSGTRGTPRGVVLAASSFAHVIEASAARMGLGPEDVWYGALSPAHIGGLVLLLRAAATGAAVYLPSRFDAEELATLVGEGRVTHASLVPIMLERYLEAVERSPPATPDSRRRMKGVLVGGAATTLALLQRAIQAGIRVYPTYGLSEACSQVATATPAEAAADPSTVGVALDGVEVRIGDTGEILVKGPTVALRYLGEDRLPVEPDGWLRTGDLGSLDAAGKLTVTGRLGDRILTGGVNIDPRQVEQAITAYPGVDQAVVVGVPDVAWGERVVALVVPATAGVNLEGLTAHLRGHLSGPKRPKAIRLVRELPRNRNGKVDRARAREIASTP